jgi:lysophospholipase L1-like esterase
MSMTGGYLALGDSYSSGEGNPPFYGLDGGCDQSINSAWPDLFDGTSLPLRYSAACSGATTRVITSPYNPVDYENGAPTAGCAVNSPVTCVDVQAPQVDVVKALMPSVITITIGGDDAQFPDMMEDCVLHNCVTDGTLLGVTTIIRTLSKKLTDVYGLIHNADPAATLLVVGYPDILPATWEAVSGLSCAWLSKDEYEGLVKVSNELNAAVQTAADGAASTWPGHVFYLSISDAFSATHRMCAGNPYLITSPVQVQGWRPWYTGHPNGAGQQAIFTLIEPKLLSLVGLK